MSKCVIIGLLRWMYVLNKIVKMWIITKQRQRHRFLSTSRCCAVSLNMSAYKGAADGFIFGLERVAWHQNSRWKNVKVYFLSPSGVSAITNILFVFIGIFVHSFAKFACFRSNRIKVTHHSAMFKTCSKWLPICVPSFRSLFCLFSLQCNGKIVSLR